MEEISHERYVYIDILKQVTNIQKHISSEFFIKFYRPQLLSEDNFNAVQISERLSI